MAKGIVRRIDELGRITLPKEYRNTYHVNCGDPLGILLSGNVVSLIKPGPKFVGIVRNVDELGRYTLPIEIRRILGIGVRQEVDVYFDRMMDGISIQKYGCEWCDETNDLVLIEGHHLCISCTAAVTAAAVKVMEE